MRNETVENLTRATEKRHKLLICGDGLWCKDRHCLKEFVRKFLDALDEKHRENSAPKVTGWVITSTPRLANEIWRELRFIMPLDMIVKADENEKVLYTKEGGVIEIKSVADPQSLLW